jgi:hypothetical protein
MREDVQKTEDTARVITPSGLAFNNEEEEEEGLLPPALPEAPAYKK